MATFTLGKPLPSPPLELVASAVKLESSGGPGPASIRAREARFIAVRRGRRAGVYTEWHEAERQGGGELDEYPEALYKTFSTRLAAEAFVAGWDGAGRHSHPKSARPRDAMSRRPGHHRSHSSFTSTLPSIPADAEWTPSLDYTLQTTPDRPGSRHHNRPSPLRNSLERMPSRSSSAPSLTALARRGSIMDRERPTKPRSETDSGLWASSQHREFPSSPTSPTSDSHSPVGLWAEPPAPPATPKLDPPLEPSLAPKFSRSALKRSGIVMPVAAPRKPNLSTSTLSSLSTNFSRQSLGSRVAEHGHTEEIGRRQSTASLDSVESMTSATTIESSPPASLESQQSISPKERPAEIRLFRKFGKALKL